MFTTPLLAALFSLLLAAPCLAHGSFVYVTNYGDGTISQFRENANGTLTPLRPAVVKAHVFCHGLAVARGRFLYAVSARDWSKRDCVISQYRIGPQGRLSALTPAQVSIPGTPATVVAEPSGRFVYVFTRQGNAAQFQIKADGRLRPLALPVIGVANAGGVAPVVGFDGPRHVLYGSYIIGMIDTVLGGTFAFTIQQNGQLKPVAHGATFHNGHQHTVSPPYSLCLTPDGRYAYVSEGLYDRRLGSQWRDVVAQYRTRSDGGLRPLSPTTVAGRGAKTIVVEPTGRFLYLVYQKTVEISATSFYCLGCAQIRRDGTLGRFTYQALGVPATLPPVQEISLVFDSTGRHCYFAEGNYVYVFRRQANGSLTPLRSARVNAGYGPLGIACVQR